ncbi:hypothetical protein B9Z55_010101 [Caenorhabditis nigoni]|uniref:LRRCT domain-containing protein n=2 Tax=Caenorhabditis nigoni TaxID=1611254 RepID=A0A2G5UEE0_9PELO|nr:hypothetical protein B9Z55_010101 [Caenorhabditis nigoni]
MRILVLMLFMSTFPSSRADLCAHCDCDFLSHTVVCNRPSLLVRTVSMLPNIQQLHLNSLNLPQPPHFLFHPNLRVLRMSRCGMHEVPGSTFLPLPGLEVIDLSNNHLETLPPTVLRSLKFLRVLILTNNRISNLDQLAWILSPGVVLEQLDLSGNPIAIATSMTVFPPVRQLFLSDTRMESVNETVIMFKKLPGKCEKDVCRHIPIHNLNISLITTIDFSSNRELEIDSGALDIFSNATFVDLSNTRLPIGFEEWLERKSRVKSLNISHCQMPLHEDTWTACGQFLHSLDISGIGAKRLRFSRFCPIRTVFARDNLLSTVYIDAVSIESMHFERNMFSDFPIPPPGVELTELHTLSLSHNLMTSLPPHALQSYPNLQHFDISHNQLSEIDPQAFPSIGLGLISLDLSSNQLSSLPHPILPSLLLLDLSSNTISHLDPHFFTGLPMLQQLRIASNPTLFSRCPNRESPCWSDHLDELTSLVDLDISNSGLEFSLHLRHLRTLKSLMLRGNEIRVIDAKSLPENLRTLDLGENRVQFTSNFSKLEHLRDLRVDQNPLRCDCSLYDIVPHLLNQSQVSDPLLYYCFSGSWQYPLLPYLASVKPCIDTTRNFYSILITTFIIAFAIVAALIGGFLVYRKYAERANFVYKRISLVESPVRL